MRGVMAMRNNVEARVIQPDLSEPAYPSATRRITSL